jgi:hypothetical protein
MQARILIGVAVKRWVTLHGLRSTSDDLALPAINPAAEASSWLDAVALLADVSFAGSGAAGGRWPSLRPKLD